MSNLKKKSFFVSVQWMGGPDMRNTDQQQRSAGDTRLASCDI